MTTPAQQVYVKDPDATLDYEIDWTPWLDGDTIATSTWILPTGITSTQNSHTDTTATVWLSGGTPYQLYGCVNRITTAGGRTNDETLWVRVLNR